MKYFRVFLLLSLVTGLTACATYEIEGRGAFSPESETGRATVHGSLYGFRWAEFSADKCETEHLFRVENNTNAAFLLVSVATLGLYVPQTVEWWCAASTEDAEGEEVWIPDAETD